MKILINILIILSLISCKENKKIKSEINTKNYIVKHAKQNEINIDGILNESDWQSANSITKFILPWENANAQHTEFKALFDDDKFYFSFFVVDTELVVLHSIETEEDLVYEDRVEIYFAFDDKLNKPYYCVEVDSKGRILDYLATYPRQFDFDVDWGSIESAAVFTDSGYIVEASISLMDMKNLGYKIYDDKTILKVAVFRADFEKNNADTLIEHWQAWINPNVPEPDYHVPSSFGNFIFGK